MEQALVGGRPSALTRAAIEDLCGYFKWGMSAVDACALSGVSVQSYRKWMMLGRLALEGEFDHPKMPADPQLIQLYMDLVTETMRAVTKPRKWSMQTILMHAAPKHIPQEDGSIKIEPGDLKAATWIMEHTSDDYAQVSKTTTRSESYSESRTDIRVRVELDETDVEHARQVAAILASVGADVAAIGLLPTGEIPAAVDGQRAGADEEIESALAGGSEVYSEEAAP